MKSIFIICTLLLLGACTGLTDTVPGVYVSRSENEFATIHDSLHVHPAVRDDEFVITRRILISYHRHDERRLQHRTEKWAAVYDNKTNELSVRDNGKIIRLDKEKNELMLGKITYKKIAYEKNPTERIVLAH